MSAARLPWWLPLAAWAGAGLLRLLGATWRREFDDAPEYTASAAAGERVIYSFWHSALLPLVLVHQREGISVLVSRHRDGELIARIIERLGYVTARGSSTRGGEAGVRELLAAAEAGRSLGITPDGPRGPAERVKGGVVYVAARTRYRVVPMAMAARPVWALGSWDRFRVPLPFARVRIAHGVPLAFEADDDRSRLALEQAIAQLTLATRQHVAEVL